MGLGRERSPHLQRCGRIEASLGIPGSHPVSIVSASLVALQTPLRIGRGIVLLWLGWRAIVTPPAHDAATAIDGTRFAPPYASAVALTFTNPMTIMAFAAVFAGAGLVAQPGAGTALVATAGVACGSLTWWVALTSGTALARHAAGDSLLTWVNRVSGALIAAFGVVAIIAGIAALL